MIIKSIVVLWGVFFFYEYEILQMDGVINDGVCWSNYLVWFIDLGKGWLFNGIIYYQLLFFNFMCDYWIFGQYQMFFKFIKCIDIWLEYNFYYDICLLVNVWKFVFFFLVGVYI